MPTILRIYWKCLSRVPGDIAKSPWVLLLPMIYGVLSAVAAMLVSPLGIVGGFLLGFVECGLIASFLFFLDEVVSRSPVRMGELIRSYQRYFWPVMNVLFVFWIGEIVLGLFVRTMANGGIIELGVMLVLAVLLNATPEVIYQRRVWGGMDVIMGSIAFIQENWIEWFIPNVLIGVAAYFLFPMLLALLAAPLGVLGTGVGGLVAGMLALPIMAFRGHLFQELDAGDARSRRFRYGR